MFTILRKLRSDTRGISALEYALLAGSILVVVGGVMTSENTGISTYVKNIFGDVQTQLKAADTAGDEASGGGTSSD